MATKDLESTSNGYQLKFNAKTHRYWMNGKPIKGVSGIKDAYPKGDGLTNWKIAQGIEQAMPMYREWYKSPSGSNWVDPTTEQLAEMIKELMVEVKKGKAAQKAADIGTLVHEYAYCMENHLFFNQEKVDKHPDKEKVENAMHNFNIWRSTCKDVVVKSEQICASWTHWFAGTFDRLVMRNNKLVLCDFKTSGSIGVEMKLQLAGYRIAAKEWLGLNIQALEVERFDKDEKGFDPVKDIWYTEDQAEIEDHEKQFLNLIATVRYDQKYNPYYKR